MPPDEEPLVRLQRWTGPWADDDAHARFKAEVALYSVLDPLQTLDALSSLTGIPTGALCRYVLTRWASGGSEGLLELGPSTVGRMWQTCIDAESEGTTAARLSAYEALRGMLSWLRAAME